jgi:lipopolysaccharide-binding protein
MVQVVCASGVVETSDNKVYGKVALHNFSLALKWSKIGNFHMSLIQVVNVSNIYAFYLFILLASIFSSVLHNIVVKGCKIKPKLNHNKMLHLQGVIRVFLNTVAMPYLNSHLGSGFILPVVHGFTLKDVNVITSGEQLTLCSDITFTNRSTLLSLPVFFIQ